METKRCIKNIKDILHLLRLSVKSFITEVEAKMLKVRNLQTGNFSYRNRSAVYKGKKMFAWRRLKKNPALQADVELSREALKKYNFKKTRVI